MRTGLTALGALVITTVGCDVGANRPAWPGTVDAEVDNLTGARTGWFRTYGPTQPLIAGSDAIPVTIGYWCRVDEDSEPVAATDGLFFKIAMPDTSLVSDDREAFEELSGQLGLLDIARMAVDGRVYAWKYEPNPTPGGWFLDGAMGFQPYELDTEVARGTVGRTDKVRIRRSCTHRGKVGPGPRLRGFPLRWPRHGWHRTEARSQVLHGGVWRGY